MQIVWWSIVISTMVVPILDDTAPIGACLASLAGQVSRLRRRMPPEEFGVAVGVSKRNLELRAAVEDRARELGLKAVTTPLPAPHTLVNPTWSRRLAMEAGMRCSARPAIRARSS